MLLDQDRAKASAAGGGKFLVPPWLRHALRTVFHLAFDAAAVAGAWYLAYLCRFEGIFRLRRLPAPPPPPFFLHWETLWLAVPMWLFLLWREDVYQRSWMDGYDRFLKVAKACFLGTGGVMLATFIVARMDYSRLMLLLLFPLSIATLTLSQFLALLLDALIKRAEIARPVLVVGPEKLATLLKKRIQARHPNAGVLALPRMPGSSELKEALETGGFYEMLLAAPEASPERLLETVELCERLGVRLKVLPSLLDAKLGQMMWDDGLGLPSFSIRHAALSGSAAWAKRTF
ncbi:MAG: hypothetical protein KGL53_03445, partial [Elusimicrobia bacterium]|nr:hypothetical protein [Elusimicrobiota bacterium]